MECENLNLLWCTFWTVQETLINNKKKPQKRSPTHYNGTWIVQTERPSDKDTELQNQP